ncbi:hypothetical protein MPK70_gp334 [Erwinia phage pEa_SNUABM_33]|uniref:Uncharacterized protein n=1 Tax=Erwinia phage pEa_SNUABM_33 TaxID=2869556 RepID=A0AAE8C087_9CAUD|nr:hypothetical protein MPK70_gp334 [Erwinia phage pEa_SNUABM_33]QZE58210.1 hypothetical protein pEaSNUABM33_00334 [Erwinia phage pEa_SNUABM_33]
MFTKENLSNGTEVRFIDLGAIEPRFENRLKNLRTSYVPPETVSVKDKDGNELDPELVGKEICAKYGCTGHTVSAHRIVDDKPVERVQLHIPQSMLSKINAIAKGEQ